MSQRTRCGCGGCVVELAAGGNDQVAVGGRTEACHQGHPPPPTATLADLESFLKQYKVKEILQPGNRHKANPTLFFLVRLNMATVEREKRPAVAAMTMMPSPSFVWQNWAVFRSNIPIFGRKPRVATGIECGCLSLAHVFWGRWRFFFLTFDHQYFQLFCIIHQWRMDTYALLGGMGIDPGAFCL